MPGFRPPQGARPKFGDIFEIATTLHQGVSLDFEGDNWNTAEGGQGGAQSGFDIIKRKRYAAERRRSLMHPRGPLKGWVDIDLFANG